MNQKNLGTFGAFGRLLAPRLNFFVRFDLNEKDRQFAFHDDVNDSEVYGAGRNGTLELGSDLVVFIVREKVC